jgi:hypothetical protein
MEVISIMKPLIIISVILMALALLCLLPIKFHIYFVQEGTSVRGKIILRLLGFLGYTVKIPPVHKEKPVRDDTGTRGLKKIQKLPPANRTLDFVRDFFRINLWLVRHITCIRFFWKTELGFGDAAATGIGSGILWSLKGVLFSLLRNIINSPDCDTDIDIIPVFDQETIRTELDCIFKLRTGYIIIACIRLLVLAFLFKLVSKGVRLRERPSN